MTHDVRKKQSLSHRSLVAGHSNKAQSMLEVAVFGAVMIFVIGTVVRQGLISTQVQNQNLKAMRMAMAASYNSGRADVTNRNTASFLVVEDRLSAEFNRQGTLSRIPAIAQGAATASIAQFKPFGWRMFDHLPVFDLFVNGQHFVMHTSDFVTHEIDVNTRTTETINHRKPAGQNTKTIQESETRARGGIEWIDNCTSNGTPCRVFYEIVPNTLANRESGKFCWLEPGETPAPGIPSGGVCSGLLTIEQRFDLNRNGLFSDDPQSSDDRFYMSWQWNAVKGVSSNVNPESRPQYDVDGDKRPEIVYGLATDANGAIISVDVLDNQEGDADFAVDDEDVPSPRLRPGFRSEADVYTRVEDGTILEVREGELFDPDSNLVVRSKSYKNKIDIVSRMFRLSADTGHFCNNGLWQQDINGDGRVDNGTDIKHQDGFCGDCFSQGKIGRTCMMETTDHIDFNGNGIAEANEVYRGHVLFMRSRVRERRGRSWVTDLSGDVFNDGILQATPNVETR